MRPPRCLLFAALVFCVLPAAARAEEPFFKKGDVIAIVGGEDMVALSEYGYLELLLTRALPDCHLRFRNLAWEGDTVFEQRRDLGFPPWEEQLEKIGATVVLCQFGQMESLAGKEKLPEFIAAYEKLLARFSGGGKRRIAIIAPIQIWKIASIPYLRWREINDAVGNYASAAEGIAKKQGFGFVDNLLPDARTQRDGVHLGDTGQNGFAKHVGFTLNLHDHHFDWVDDFYPLTSGPLKPLRQLIIAKNRLWFDYWRVQNWAFLAGDRTNQPSSRDHLDPAKRWFPEERERFLPLIEAREKEIDALAAKLAQP